MLILLSPKSGYFPKGLTPGFSQKTPNFSGLFLSKIGLEIMLSYGLKRNKAFHDDKKVNFLNSKK